VGDHPAAILMVSAHLTNVVVINSETGSQGLAEITEFNQYRSLVEWATLSVEAGRLLDLPREFNQHRIHPWR
jgi:hypothetical protein